MFRRVVGGAAGLGVIAGTSLLGLVAGPMEDLGGQEAGREDLVARGRYLVEITGCADCHTPHGKDGKPIAALHLTGHPEHAPLPEWEPAMLEKNILATISPTLTAFAGPFGLSVAGNLTPCPETGIGPLTAEELIKSWRTGMHWKVQREVLPPMPMAAYERMTDDDIRAIHAYLISLKPIRNAFPSSRPVAPPGS